MDGELD